MHGGFATLQVRPSPLEEILRFLTNRDVFESMSVSYLFVCLNRTFGTSTHNGFLWAI